MDKNSTTTVTLDLDAIETRAATVVRGRTIHVTDQAWTSSYMASAVDVPALLARVRELELFRDLWQGFAECFEAERDKARERVRELEAERDRLRTAVDLFMERDRVETMVSNLRARGCDGAADKLEEGKLGEVGRNLFASVTALR